MTLHKTRLGRAQKQCRIGHLVRLTHPLHRSNVSKRQDRLLVLFPGHNERSFDDPRADAIDSDAVGRVINRITARQPYDSGFGRAVRRSAWPSHNAQLAGNVDNRAPLRRPQAVVASQRLLVHHRLELGPARQPAAAVVDGIDAVEFLDRRRGRVSAWPKYTRTIHAVVEPPKYLHDLCEEVVDELWRAYVAGQGEDLGLGKLFLDGLLGALQRCGVDVGNGDSRAACFRKGVGGRVANARSRCPRDESDTGIKSL